jgi:hypothetical protein
MIVFSAARYFFLQNLDHFDNFDAFFGQNLAKWLVWQPYSLPLLHVRRAEKWLPSLRCYFGGGVQMTSSAQTLVLVRCCRYCDFEIVYFQGIVQQDGYNTLDLATRCIRTMICSPGRRQNNGAKPRMPTLPVYKRAANKYLLLILC